MRIRLQNLTKKFDETVAVHDFTAQLPSGELLCLLGPSGCGKSTILNMLSGIVPVTSGRIYFDDRDVTDLEPEKRGIGLVFQNYALYPHMTVLENICFPLEIQGVPKKERIARATEMAEMVYVDKMLKRRPAQLSGGQQQRVAIARALVKRPDFLGNPPINKMKAVMRTGKIFIDGTDQGFARPGTEKLADGLPVHLSIRAESFDTDGDPAPVIDGTITGLSLLGKDVLANIRIGNHVAHAFMDPEIDWKIGQNVPLGLRLNGVFLFDRETGERLV